jgi:hypothetical protein
MGCGILSHPFIFINKKQLEIIMNQPLRKSYNEKGDKVYIGDFQSVSPNRKQRRLALQKDERNTFGIKPFWTRVLPNGLEYLDYVQRVWDKKLEVFKRIVHTVYKTK